MKPSLDRMRIFVSMNAIDKDDADVDLSGFSYEAILAEDFTEKLVLLDTARPISSFQHPNRRVGYQYQA